MDELKNELIIDKVNHNYLLASTGWYNNSFKYNVVFHFAIKPTGKIWIFVNSTDIPLEQYFVRAGIPLSDVVPAFHPEDVREYAGYGIS